METSIRNETESDYRRVEEITREAFWNLHVPGCDEHYLAHVMRTHRDFIKDLDYVVLVDGELVGNIMFARSSVVNEKNAAVEVLTFGPVSVLPEYQKKGIGSSLIRHAMRRAGEMGYTAVIIYGNPKNYCRHGFKSSKDYGISAADGKYPFSLLTLELVKGTFADHSWRFFESDVYNIDEHEAEEFDRTFAPREKSYRYTQEEFSIARRAFIE